MCYRKFTRYVLGELIDSVLKWYVTEHVCRNKSNFNVFLPGNVGEFFINQHWKIVINILCYPLVLWCFNGYVEVFQLLQTRLIPYNLLRS